MTITHAELLNLLLYVPETGRWYWRINVGNVKAGTETGKPTLPKLRGYVKIDGRRYIASRLAWFYMTGEWPEVMVDHRDTDVTNNRWSNLRLATASQNCSNAKRKVTNTSGFKGVHKLEGKWAARICHEGSRVYIGRFNTREEAAAAYAEAAKAYKGEFANLGTSPVGELLYI